MTYSIVARDPETGELGVAVQSHWFSVGSVVTWAAPGVGAVATQSIVDITYGPHALELLRDGADAGSALATLVTRDRGSADRQVAIVDVAGRTAVHTGAGAVGYAGHVTGEQVSCQANMMSSPTVWPAMLTTFQNTPGRLADRLLAALEAAEAQGGDVRGRQSAALLVAPAQGEWWQRVVELRVEDHPDPLPELRRLLSLADAYALASAADERSSEGRHAEASELYRRASALAPGSEELRFWAGLSAAQAGELDDGVADVRAAIASRPQWRELLERLPPTLAPAAPAVLRALDQG
jgi:uncharacterized Ntn-hydrolase superfamily protein